MQLMRPLQSSSTHIVRSTTGVYQDYVSTGHLRDENARLRSEVQKLETDETKIRELEQENRRLSGLLELRDVMENKAVGSSVIGSDATGLARTLILSEGEDAGIRNGMAVVSTQGVIGRVIAVSAAAAKVLRIDDHNSALDAFDQRSRARGIAAGIVDGGMTLKYVERTSDLKEGDSVVTSGLDGVFPRGLLVGRVTRVQRSGGLFLNVEFSPAVDFKNLEQVLVITQQTPQLAERQGRN